MRKPQRARDFYLPMKTGTPSAKTLMPCVFDEGAGATGTGATGVSPVARVAPDGQDAHRPSVSDGQDAHRPSAVALP